MSYLRARALQELIVEARKGAAEARAADEQLRADLAAALEVVKAAEAYADQFSNKVSGFPRRDALVAAVDTWRQTKGET